MSINDHIIIGAMVGGAAYIAFEISMQFISLIKLFVFMI